MRSYSLWIVACAVLSACSGTEATDSPPINFDIGETLPTSVTTNLLSINDFICQLRTPKGEVIQFLPENKGDPAKYTLREYNMLTGCAVEVKITDDSDEGIWELTFIPNSGAEGRTSTYNIAVNAPVTTTTEAVERTIENIDSQFIDTSVGAIARVNIQIFGFMTHESCHIESPDGIVYDLDSVTLNGIEYVTSSSFPCGVNMQVAEDLIGTWTLISRDTRFTSDHIERRLQFTIYVEEKSEASPNEIAITEGNDLYLRLKNPTPYHDTCKLVDPIGNTVTTVTKDEHHLEECGYLIPNAQRSSSGVWQIVYGTRIIYKASINVNVRGPTAREEIRLEWPRDRPVDQLLGPEDAVYCRLTDPNDRVVFDGFERCRVTLDRARDQHSGVWTMTVGHPGGVITEDWSVLVTVIEAARRPRVITRVEKERPVVTLTCALEGVHTITACKFREPSGRVLLASQGVGEDRYTFHGVGVSLESNVNSTSCGLRISNPVTEDLGLWRCAVETADDEVYYGFLTVICPFVMSQPNPPPIVTEPTLTVSHQAVVGVENEAVTMGCSIQSEIRYCYFRARNGSVFNVSPGSDSESDLYEYAGAGFDAGECSIRFRGLHDRDTGAWSCHVGLAAHGTPEQRVSFGVTIHRPIVVEQYEVHGGLQVVGHVYDGRSVEYCRFVRIDGFGFTTENVPERVQDHGSQLAIGVCSILISNPTILDHHPWTIAARIVGQDTEVSDRTDHTIEMPAPDVEDPLPPTTIIHTTRGGIPLSLAWVLIVLLIVTLSLLMFNMAVRHRQWAHGKFNSLRSSFRKKPLPDTLPPYTQTVNAA